MPNARVLVSLLTDQEEFQRLQAADAKATAELHGLDVEVVFAENNGVVQIQQLFRAVHAGPEARPTAIIVETVTGEGLERVARSAVKAGVGWILLNRRVPYLAVAGPGLEGSGLIGRHATRSRSDASRDGSSAPWCRREATSSTSRGRPIPRSPRSAWPECAPRSRARDFAVNLASGLWTEASGAQAIGCLHRASRPGSPPRPTSSAARTTPWPRGR